MKGLLLGLLLGLVLAQAIGSGTIVGASLAEGLREPAQSRSELHNFQLLGSLADVLISLHLSLQPCVRTVEEPVPEPVRDTRGGRVATSSHRLAGTSIGLVQLVGEVTMSHGECLGLEVLKEVKSLSAFVVLED